MSTVYLVWGKYYDGWEHSEGLLGIYSTEKAANARKEYFNLNEGDSETYAEVTYESVFDRFEEIYEN